MPACQLHARTVGQNGVALAAIDRVRRRAMTWLVGHEVCRDHQPARVLRCGSGDGESGSSGSGNGEAGGRSKNSSTSTSTSTTTSTTTTTTTTRGSEGGGGGGDGGGGSSGALVIRRDTVWKQKSCPCPP